MTRILFHNKLVSFLKAEKIRNFDSQFIDIELSDSGLANAQKNGIKAEELYNSIRLSINELKILIYEKTSDFLNTSLIQEESEILILNLSDNKVISFIEGKTFINFIEVNDFFLFTNALAYKGLQNFLKTQEKEIDTSFHFIDVYNIDLRKITLVSLSEKCRLTITYDFEIPNFDTTINYSNALQNFKKCFDEVSKTLPKFLKNSIINNLSTNSPTCSLSELFKKLDNIVEKAQINFEVYLNNLSIDKIKKDYDEIKTKYLSDLSGILSKLTNQIIALPIGIATTLFAIEKVSTNSYFLVIIAVVITITSIYLTLLLKVNFSDLYQISNVLKDQFQILTENNFFKKYPNEQVPFDNIKNRVEQRINFLKVLTETYYWVLNTANIAIIAYMLYQLFELKNIAIFIVIVLFFFVAIMRNKIVDKDNYA